MEYKMTTHAKSQENQSNIQGGKKKCTHANNDMTEKLDFSAKILKQLLQQYSER